MSSDERTQEAYETGARGIAARHRAMVPESLYRLARAHFHPGAATADIGSGSGRDVEWLEQEGFPTHGFDGSPAMLAEAHAAYPGRRFERATLPALAGVPDGAFANVLCSATLMHLPASDLIEAATNLARILTPGGRLILSIRAGMAGEEREADGRLYTAIPPGRLTLLLESVGLRVLVTQAAPDGMRPEVEWHTWVAEKGALDVARGLDRIQAVLAQDRKFATYKLALVRALCHASRAPGVVRWGAGEVYVPLWSLAVQWLIFYWPLMTAPQFIAQLRGERPDSRKPVAFRSIIKDLAAQFGSAGLYDLLRQMDERPGELVGPLRRIGHTIRVGPVRYSGTEGPALFEYRRSVPGRERLDEGRLGWVVVPEALWLDLCRFDHWIEESVIVRWARLTAEMNPTVPGIESLVFPLLLQTPADPRTTTEVRALVGGLDPRPDCVWSGEPLRHRYDIDHAIPYTVWGNNDLWNLLPVRAAYNRQKSDRLPTAALLRRRSDSIAGYWRLYRAHAPIRFDAQLRRALGSDAAHDHWERSALAGLHETIERLATTRGLGRWEP